MNISKSICSIKNLGGGLHRDFIFFFILILIYEIVYRLNLKSAFFGSGLFYIIIFSLFYAAVSTITVSMFGRKTHKAAETALASLYFLFYSSQMCYYEIFGEYYTMFSAVNGGEAFQFKSAVFHGIENSFAFIAADFIALAVFILLSIKNSDFLILRGRELVTTVACAAIMFCIALISLLPGGTSVLSPYDTYMNSASAADMRLDKFGIMTTFRVDFERYFLGIPDVTAIQAEDRDDNLDAGDGAEEYEKYEPNVMNIDFNAIAESRSDESLKAMDEYFAGRQPTYKNSMSGIYEGYNFIYITAEGFSPYAIDKELTPTLYKMYSQGYNFTDFYNPIWGVSTSDGEYVNCQGLIPKSGVWSMSKSHDNYLPFTFGNQFKKLGYDTLAYHNHSYGYYDRDKSHPNMGYDYKGLGNGLNVTKQWPESDLEMMENTVDEYIGSEKFHVYYMTVSGHMLYNFGGNRMAAKNREAVKELSYSEACKAYISCNIEFDKAMEYLLGRLEEAGIAEKTVIAVAADHYPYGLENSEISEFLGHDVDTQFELYKSCFLLYVPGMEPVTVDKSCSTLDILPTLSNMFGLEYDSRLLMGRDIFSESEPLVVFNSKNWITDKGRFIADKGEFTAFDSSTEENFDEYTDLINSHVSNMFKVSAEILGKDYYRTVLGE
ncbi:MAG: LTA synthase family protein [Bacillota bacterium]|nr:LTA synthase family protein [Bacillota bacterium]